MCWSLRTALGVSHFLLLLDRSFIVYLHCMHQLAGPWASRDSPGSISSSELGFQMLMLLCPVFGRLWGFKLRFWHLHDTCFISKATSPAQFRKKLKLLFVNRKKNANSCKNMGYWKINYPKFKIHKNGFLMTLCIGFRKKTKWLYSCCIQYIVNI